MRKDKFEILKDLLKKYKEKGIIQEYDYEHFKYWDNVPCITLENGQKIFLAYTFYYLNGLNIQTIKDLKTKSRMKNALNKIIDYFNNNLYESEVLDVSILKEKNYIKFY